MSEKDNGKAVPMQWKIQLWFSKGTLGGRASTYACLSALVAHGTVRTNELEISAHKEPFPLRNASSNIPRCSRTIVFCPHCGQPC
jgi:hypothetical protein